VTENVAGWQANKRSVAPFQGLARQTCCVTRNSAARRSGLYSIGPSGLGDL
jgi:hypothetical protein